jgi:hypothetical protein
MKEVYAAIQLKPDQFPDFLTTEVGFQSFEIAGSAESSNKGMMVCGRVMYYIF